MTAAELMEELARLGVRLSLDGRVLVVKPASKVPPDLVAAIKEARRAIREALEQKQAPSDPLPTECTCIWLDPVLPPPHYCPRCEETGLCRTCGGCRTCWLKRIGIIVGNRPSG
jgi:hypothetical protein